MIRKGGVRGGEVVWFVMERMNFSLSMNVAPKSRLTCLASVFVIRECLSVGSLRQTENNKININIMCDLALWYVQLSPQWGYKE